jgi:hypothetical protein
MLPYIYQLTKDPFGNYVIQKILEYSHLSKRKYLIVSKLEGNFQELALNTYSCRVIQKLLEVADIEDVRKVFAELKNVIVYTIFDQNGNHVIQKIIERITPEENSVIIDLILSKVK